MPPGSDPADAARRCWRTASSWPFNARKKDVVIPIHNRGRPPDPRDFIPEAVDNPGLKMEARKAASDVLVVDHAERASPK
ncbi:MAG: hypothetical protein P4L56_22010 [Candidatus Sulfopaludibacter sp.]|nr:hypothetical protein [Candidatus Sulfopaludibacter sp.]